MNKYWNRVKPIIQEYVKQFSNPFNFPGNYISIVRRWFILKFGKTMIGYSLGLFVFCYLIVQIFGDDVGSKNFWTEFWSLVLDIFFILVIFGLFQDRRQQLNNIARQEEIIEDLKRWDNEESMHRIVGAVRRLNNMGKTKIDLRDATLSGAEFEKYGVESLRGSNLSGKNIIPIERDTYSKSNFKKIDFSSLDLQEVIFGYDAFKTFKSGIFKPQYIISSHYKNCNFCDSNLENSVFDSAKLWWDTQPPDSLEEEVGEIKDGYPITGRTHFDSFNDTRLKGVSFRKCQFHHADFREAFNVEEAEFAGAKGLETCVFDTEELKTRIIAKAKKSVA